MYLHVTSYKAPDRYTRYSTAFSKSYCAMCKRRAQFSLRHRHLVCCSSTMKVQKARAFRVRVLCASLWLSVEIYQYADGAHESFFWSSDSSQVQSLFFFHVNCRRITGSGNSKCPLPADISVRVRRFPVFAFFCRRGYCSPGTSTRFNHRLLSLSTIRNGTYSRITARST